MIEHVQTFINQRNTIDPASLSFFQRLFFSTINTKKNAVTFNITEWKPSSFSLKISTMAMISYGINDWAAAQRIGPQNLPKSADELLVQTEKIYKAGITNFVVLCKSSKLLTDLLFF